MSLLRNALRCSSPSSRASQFSPQQVQQFRHASATRIATGDVVATRASFFARMKQHVNPTKAHEMSRAARDYLAQFGQNLLLRAGWDFRKEGMRKNVVVLGSGWGAVNFIVRLDISKYDVTVVSPRNYFTMNPLLPAVCAGTLLPRTCLEPLRNKLARGGKKVMDFYEAWAVQCDPKEKSVICKSQTGEEFKLNYDYLVVSVGAETATFGIPGVAEHAHFLKEIEHSRSIHKRVIDLFEQAALPNISDKQRLLHIVVVGGGPTGVETAAEIQDFIRENASRHFPDLAPLARVTLVEMLPKVLPMFSQSVSDFSLKNLQKVGVETKMQSRVTGMTDHSVTIAGPDGKEETVLCSLVLWASGLRQVPFARDLMASIPAQKSNNVMRVDERLQVIGGGPVYALGDCSVLTPEPAARHAESLYRAASMSPEGAGATWLVSEACSLESRFPQFSPVPECLKTGRDNLTLADFTKLLEEVDKSYKPPPPTAQNAKQAGRYLASMFNEYHTTSGKEKARAYVYRWRGSIAYVGHGKAVVESPLFVWLGGLHANLASKAFYWGQQMSWNNRALLLFDWIRTCVRGRDLGREHSDSAIPPNPKK